jgi:hypothetical protein
MSPENLNVLVNLPPTFFAVPQLRSHFQRLGKLGTVRKRSFEARVKKGELTAMLDVFDKEPLQADSSLRALDNAFLTPHRAGGLMSSVRRALDMLIGDLELKLKRKERRYGVTASMLPCFPE